MADTLPTACAKENCGGEPAAGQENDRDRGQAEACQIPSAVFSPDLLLLALSAILTHFLSGHTLSILELAFIATGGEEEEVEDAESEEQHDVQMVAKLPKSKHPW
ncbi:hypothetical protein H920_09573 [Fukomys damarensis]|uniref:Uncharacterized protein n=1 Tax=Fukomys damarensis TaxID=885580 RepID=A0A091E1V1_FUKDA|nr:hypothetical protein H920_09573 [Fukomys damarensis]